MEDRMLVRYFEVALCLLFMIDGVHLEWNSDPYYGLGGYDSCDVATYTGDKCCCYIGSSQDRCCRSLHSNYCCTQTEETYGGLYCESSIDCGSSAKPICCSVSKKCCTKQEHEIESPRCNSIAECANVAGAPYCCDREARCCTHATYTEESCSGDYDCQTTTKPHCCDNSKCCTPKQYAIENPTPSEMLRRNGAALCAVALLLLVGMISLSILSVGCVYTFGAKPTKRLERALSTQSLISTVTSTIDLPTPQQHATPPLTQPRGHGSNEDGSIPYQAPAVATNPIAELPAYNDLPPSYELATTSNVFTTATIPSGGSCS